MLARVGFLLGRALRETGQALDRAGSRVQGNYAFKETLNRHRRVMALFDKRPVLGDDVFIAPNASVIGNVSIGTGAAVWYGSVLRGDVNTISIGDKSSIGDNCVVHVSGSEGGAFGDAAPLRVEKSVVVEPGSILHGCELKSGCRVGSGSVIFDKAVVGESAQLAPGSMLTAGKEIPARQLWGGRPAQFIRDLTDEEVRGLEKGAADAYEAAKAHEAEHKLTAEERMERAEERLYHKQNEAPPEF